MKNIRVCFIVPVPPPYGGIANWYIMIKKYIQEEYDDIELTTISISPKKFRVDARNYFDRIFVSGIDMFRIKRKVKKTIQSNNCNVIHMTTSGQLAIIRDILILHMAKLIHVPTIYHIRFGRIENISKRNTVEWKLLRIALNLATVVIAIDKRTENALSTYMDRKKILYIPNPINVAAITEIVNCEREKFVIYLGHVIKTKGIEELIEAWNQLSKKYEDYSLKIVGSYDADYYAYLKDKCKTSSIEFCGDMNHKDALKMIARARVLVLPSYTEGFPNSILEAFAMKTPVIATNVGAIPEILSDHCGILIEQKSSKQIINALEKTLNDEELRIELAENAYKKLNREYDLPHIINEYKKLWKKLTKVGG